LARARVVLTAAFLLAIVTAPAAATIVRTRTAQAVFTLQPNGVLAVLEHLNVNADAPTPATWQVTMQRGELFAEPSLVVDGRRYRAGDGKRPGTFRISRGSGGVRFDWLQPTGAREVRLGYRLALFGTAYSDVVDLRVPVWESWPTPVGRLTAALKLPRVPRGRAIVWVEPRSVTAGISTAGREIRLSAADVDADRSVTLRSVLPRGVLTSADGLNVESKPGLPTVLAQREPDSRTWWPWALGAAAIAAVSALVVLRTARSRRPLPR